MHRLRVTKSKGDPLKVACCNWNSEYPYVPEVEFTLWHDGAFLYIEFSVAERYTLGAVDCDNGPCWTDSCVELFITPDDSGYYYNFEFTCTGKLLLGYRSGREGAEIAPLSVIESVKRMPSLGTKRIGLTENCNWDLRVAIPVTALFKHNLKSWSGLCAKGNIYKCGNNLPERHFLSYAPIDTPKPDFHRPEYFIPIDFD